MITTIDGRARPARSACSTWRRGDGDPSKRRRRRGRSIARDRLMADRARSTSVPRVHFGGGGVVGMGSVRPHGIRHDTVERGSSSVAVTTTGRRRCPTARWPRTPATRTRPVPWQRARHTRRTAVVAVVIPPALVPGHERESGGALAEGGGAESSNRVGVRVFGGWPLPAARNARPDLARASFSVGFSSSSGPPTRRSRPPSRRSARAWPRRTGVARLRWMAPSS